MDNYVLIQKRVPVIARFSMGEERLICTPIKMRHNGQEITFTELGLRHPTSKGKRMVHVFDVSDGQTDYRLEFDAASLRWELISAWEVTS